MFSFESVSQIWLDVSHWFCGRRFYLLLRLVQSKAPTLQTAMTIVEIVDIYWKKMSVSTTISWNQRARGWILKGNIMHYRPLHNTSVGRGSDYSVKAAVISIFILTADQTSTCVVKGITRCSSLQLFDVFQLIVLVFRAKALSSWLTFTALFQLFLTVC